MVFATALEHGGSPKALGHQAVHETCQRVYPSPGTCMNTQLHLLVPVQ
ncbi:BIM1/ dihydrolipoamide acyltransferase protein [Giardia duodenalis assemblage B]|uniref:BIM1/ dihydrolipoamide acyltransferase protein n=1 Tax=Giardia duodenalis assemblage B TaxID=1394984 RepID=A0A132NNI8_GIAIN|nr:BIM1/ dihydrolipoamide acyltransferase protein [Giardia intestinalis assemblage B]